jgi:hypothetical protein
VIYGYSEAHPDACLLLCKQVLVTVLARDRPHPVDKVGDPRGLRCAMEGRSR